MFRRGPGRHRPGEGGDDEQITGYQGKFSGGEGAETQVENRRVQIAVQNV